MVADIKHLELYGGAAGGAVIVDGEVLGGADGIAGPGLDGLGQIGGSVLLDLGVDVDDEGLVGVVIGVHLQYFLDGRTGGLLDLGLDLAGKGAGRRAGCGGTGGVVDDNIVAGVTVGAVGIYNGTGMDQTVIPGLLGGSRKSGNDRSGKAEDQQEREKLLHGGFVSPFLK